MSESTTRRAARSFSLIAKALPITFLLLAWPIFLVSTILPNSNFTLATTLLLLHVCILVFMQILGSCRAYESWKVSQIQLHSETSTLTHVHVINPLNPGLSFKKKKLKFHPQKIHIALKLFIYIISNILL